MREHLAGQCHHCLCADQPKSGILRNKKKPSKLKNVPKMAAVMPERYKVLRSVIKTTEIKMMDSCKSKPAKSK